MSAKTGEPVRNAAASAHASAAHAVTTVGVIGAGLMGQSIAVTAAEHGMGALITDASSQALSSGLEKIRDALSENSAARALIRGTMSDSELADADLVMETVVESLNVKRRVCRRLDQLLGTDRVLASNTSSFPIGQIAAELAHPERFCGIHFCHPVKQRALVELVAARRTSDQTMTAARHFVRSLEKLPVVVKDSPGFVVNRLLFPYLNEAVTLVSEGVAMESIEEAATAFGMPVGPLTQLDGIGIDVAVRAGHALCKAYADRFEAAKLLGELFAAGQLGQKTGRGFFTYGSRDRPGVQCNPDAVALARPGPRRPRPVGQDEISDRLFLLMLVEASRVLEEGLVPGPDDVDLALIHGIGFPQSKGGVLRWADATGASSILDRLKRYEGAGSRYHPTQTLLTMARDAGRFYRE